MNNLRLARPRGKTALVAIAFFSALLIASGAVAYGADGSPVGTAAWIFWPGGWADLPVTPALAVLIGGHWFVYLAALPTLLAALVASLFGLALELELRSTRADGTCAPRLGLLGALPAMVAAPLCCAPSLLSLLVPTAAAALRPLALPLLALSAALLSVHIFGCAGGSRGPAFRAAASRRGSRAGSR